ncbi:MAG: dihydrodipicolinate synthase family protein [Ginsengibacter sp.]
METSRLPGGLWPVMLTPFLENNEIDYPGLEKLTNFYIEAGASGLFANCLSSEMFQLTNKERLQLIRAVIQAADSKAGVVASGTFSPDMETCATFIKQVYDTGVDAVIVISNQIADIDEDDDVFKKRIDLLLQLTGDIPLGLYECPYPYKRLISPGLMKWLAQTGRFHYHKDTSCDLTSVQNKLAAIKGTSYSLYDANTTTALSSLESGATGISAIGANFYPELYSFLYNEFKKKGSSKALVQLNAGLVMMDAIVDQGYPFSAKLFLQKRGFPISTVCRIQHEKMNAENYLKLDALMEVFLQMANQYKVTIRQFD